jgi:hypothetical protein
MGDELSTLPPPAPVELTDEHRAAVCMEIMDLIATANMAHTTVEGILMVYFRRAMEADNGKA